MPGDTLVILDEIQAYEQALTSLKYFAEQAPQYHIAAAGSLLGVAMKRERFSFPVGKVDMLHLFPMDFEEFLWAIGQEPLCDLIREAYEGFTPLSLHDTAMDLYNKNANGIILSFPSNGSKFIHKRGEENADARILTKK